DHEVGLVPRNGVRTFARDLDVYATLVDGSRDHVVVQVQGQPQGVEAGSKIGAGGRYLDVHLVRFHGHASPSRTAAACPSTGTVTGLGAPEIAQSGSLSPLPVTVQTTVDPEGIRPSRAVISSPAMLAADAGSTKIPSERAMSR